MKAILLAFTALAATMTVSPSFAADERNVTVVNGTGYGIKFLGFNNPGDNDWSDNELPSSSVFPSGNSVYAVVQHRGQRLQVELQDRVVRSGLPGRDLA